MSLIVNNKYLIKMERIMSDYICFNESLQELYDNGQNETIELDKFFRTEV